MTPPGAISPAITRVMVALVAEHVETGRATMRSVARRAGLPRALGNVYSHLWELRRLGLATWEPGTHGTLRPTVHPQTLK